eukprot:m.188310 g.188310  ORF g.188310 m.188310 type:complete len:848 (+) comp17384_c0_seq1:177-2720(+)
MLSHTVGAALILSTLALTLSMVQGQTDVRALDGSVIVAVDSTGMTHVTIQGQTFAVSGGLTKLGPGTIPTPVTCAEAGPATLVPPATVTREWACSVPVVMSTRAQGGSRGTHAHPNTFTSTPETVAVTVTTADSFLPAPTSVLINTTITVAKTTSSWTPFTTALYTNVTMTPMSSSTSTPTDRQEMPFKQVWTTWGKGCVNNNGNDKPPGMCFAGGGEWSNPLTPEDLPTTLEQYRYGAALHLKDSFTLPVVTLLGGGNGNGGGVGMSLALSPEDPTLEVGLGVQANGVAFSRQLLRLGGPSPVTFSAHIVGHANCWRPALQWFVSAYPDFFESWVPHAADFEGLGSYSWNQQSYNATRARALGFKTNWDLSGTFMPYDGLFLPYQDSWLNLGPINGGLKQYNVTYAKIEAYYQSIQSLGFHSLSYFDIGNWGTQTNTHYTGPNRTCGVRPGGQPAPCPDPDGANSYLRDFLWDALLQSGWSVPVGKFTQAMHDWVGTTDMDTAEPAFEDLIVEQAARHLQMIPSFEGIAIDRLDYSELFNYNADDGVSWVPVNSTSGNSKDLDIYGPARALRLSYRHTFNRLHELFHSNHQQKMPPSASERHSTTTQKIMMMNCNTLCRLDEMRSFDATFSEGSSLNAVAWTGIRQPTILWTYNLAADNSTLDPFFQQHLLMNVYPMAPMPLNDHSINPGSPVVEQAYEAYAPMFDAMHGARWLLSAQPVSLQGDATAAANVFMLPSNTTTTTSYSTTLSSERVNQNRTRSGTWPDLLTHVMLGSAASTSVSLTLHLGPAAAMYGWPAVRGAAAKALHPGSATWTPLTSIDVSGQDVVMTVPLSRGCAAVHVSLTV